MEATANKVTEQAQKVFSSLEKEFVRKVQRDMYTCSAKCMDNDSSSPNQIQGCLEACQRPFERLSSYITSETDLLQNRLQRCALDCQDSARDKKGSADNQAIQAQYEGCVNNCADKCIAGFPDWHKKIRNNIMTNSF